MLLTLHLCLHLGCSCVETLYLICIRRGDLESAFSWHLAAVVLLVAIACSCTYAAVVVQWFADVWCVLAGKLIWA